MPEEAVAATPASSPAAAASPSPAAPAAATPAAAASPSSPATAGAAATTPATPAGRPDWAPETVWDAASNTFKPDALKASFEEANALKAFKAAEESKKLSLPQKPEEYKLALPKEWKAPDGVEFKLDEADPLFTQARDWAHKNGISQDAFEQGLSMIAARDVASAQMINEARGKEIGKLGVNGTARVTALNTFLDAKGYAPLKGMMVTAEIVTTLEKLVADMTGGSAFSQAHREPPPEANKINGIEKMDFRQARMAQDAVAKRA